jgi:hypothetical protein
LPVPVRVDRQVPGHGEDPRPLPVVRHLRQLLQVLPDPQEDVLRQVGGRLRVTGPAGEVGVHRDTVRLVEAADVAVGRIRAAAMASHRIGRITSPRATAGTVCRVRAARRAPAARRPCLASRISSSARIFTIISA